jgi:hypothetical protein
MNPQMNDARVANKNLLFDVGVRPNRRSLALFGQLDTTDTTHQREPSIQIRTAKFLEGRTVRTETWRLWLSSAFSQNEYAPENGNYNSSHE